MTASLNGVNLAWDEAGDGDWLVLVHGLSESRHVWAHQIRDFARRFRVLSLDVRGFGDSEVGAGAGTPRQLGDDLAALVTHAVGDQGAHVLGFSMGGVIAMRFGIDHPALAQTLVVASSSAAINDATYEWFDRRRDLALNRPRMEFDRMNAADAKTMLKGSKRSLIEFYSALRTNSVKIVSGYANACEAMQTLRERPLLNELPTIKCPVLVLTGELDASCPPTAATSIQRRIPNSQLAILPRLGHLAHLQSPETFNQEVLGFLSSSARSSLRS